jgi:putative flippase GtrA
MADGIAARLRSPDARRFVRFLAVGLLNTAFGYLVFAAGVLSGLAPAAALLAATLIGVGFNFATTGRLVFASRDTRRLPRFVLCYALAYVLNAGALHGLAALGVPPLAGQLLLLPPVVVLTFLAMRLFVFREVER